MVAMLNAPTEARVCQEMIDLVAKEVSLGERRLCEIELDRESYLRAISSVQSLRAIRDQMTDLYRRRFNS